jgi:glyoxylase-like metal-dependent hydrolase (beta-lactamase superfamily II)
MKVTPNIHVIPGVSAHPWLLVDPDGLTLIDTGMPGSSFLILGYIKRLGYAYRDVNRILLTHADTDHAGSLAALKRATGARVYASIHEARAVAAGRLPRPLKTTNILIRTLMPLLERLGRISPAHVDEHLFDGQVLPVLRGLRVVDTSGHTPGHISFFAPSEGVLFTGDSIVSAKNQLFGSRWYVTWDQDKADAAIHRQVALGARIVCPGHGAAVTNGLGRMRRSLTGSFATSPA